MKYVTYWIEIKNSCIEEEGWIWTRIKDEDDGGMKDEDEGGIKEKDEGGIKNRCIEGEGWRWRIVV